MPLLKRYADWEGNLGDFLQIGDLVDEEMADYFVNALPPACWTASIIQMGEAHNHVEGRATYATLKRTADGWAYAGNCYRRETVNIEDPEHR